MENRIPEYICPEIMCVCACVCHLPGVLRTGVSVRWYLCAFTLFHETLVKTASRGIFVLKYDVKMCVSRMVLMICTGVRVPHLFHRSSWRCPERDTVRRNLMRAASTLYTEFVRVSGQDNRTPRHAT